MNIPKYHAKEFHNLVHSNVFCPMKQSFIIGFKYTTVHTGLLDEGEV